MMRRRALFQTLAGLAAGIVTPAAAEEARGRRVVYHIADVEKVGFALVNMKNHRIGGPPGLELAAVVHGPALAALRAKSDNDQLKRDFSARQESGDRFFACANTLAAHGWTLDDVLPGFLLADKGGVVKLADLQAQGWLYLRP